MNLGNMSENNGACTSYNIYYNGTFRSKQVGSFVVIDNENIIFQYSDNHPVSVPGVPVTITGKSGKATFEGKSDWFWQRIPASIRRKEGATLAGALSTFVKDYKGKIATDRFELRCTAK